MIRYGFFLVLLYAWGYRLVPADTIISLLECSFSESLKVVSDILFTIPSYLWFKMPIKFRNLKFWSPVMMMCMLRFSCTHETLLFNWATWLVRMCLTSCMNVFISMFLLSLGTWVIYAFLVQFTCMPKASLYTLIY